MIISLYNSDINILEVKISGHVTIGELKEHLKDINNRQDLPKQLHILTDTIDAIFTSSPNDSKSAADFNYSLPKRYDHIKVAILTDDPNQTSIILLFQHLARSKNYNVKVFVLKENATQWLRYT